MIHLKKADRTDCQKIHTMQVKAFQALLDQYHDTATNPGAEPLDHIIKKMEQSFTDYYFILLENVSVGVIRIVRSGDTACRIAPMFILPEFQGKGYAQQAILAAEALYPHATDWQLDTIKEEPKLCHIYEKMGYKRTGKEEVIQDKMTIVYYAKSYSSDDNGRMVSAPTRSPTLR